MLSKGIEGWIVQTLDNLLFNCLDENTFCFNELKTYYIFFKCINYKTIIYFYDIKKNNRRINLMTICINNREKKIAALIFYLFRRIRKNESDKTRAFWFGKNIFTMFMVTTHILYLFIHNRTLYDCV